MQNKQKSASGKCIKKWKRPILTIFKSANGKQEMVLISCKIGPDPSIDVFGEYSGCEGAPGDYGNCYACNAVSWS